MRHIETDKAGNLWIVSKRPRRSRVPLLLCAVAACLLGAARCWHWNGQQSRLLAFEQAVDQAERSQAAYAIYLRARESLDALDALAKDPGASGERARQYAELIRGK